MQACKDISLTGQKYHFQILEVPQEEHATVHHVEEALVHKLVLVVNNLNDALLDGECHGDVEHLLIYRLSSLHLYLMFLEDSFHACLKR